MAAIAVGRHVALAALLAFRRGQRVDHALAAALSAEAPLAARDRALATELVYGTVRRLRTLDYVIGQFSSRPPERLDSTVLAALRLATYQILYLERIPAHAAVHQAVEQARLTSKQAAAFTNAVLRALLRGRDNIDYPDPAEDPVRYLGIVHSHPDWLVRRYLQQFTFSEAAALCAANNENPDVVVRVNSMRSTTEQVTAKLRGVGVAVAPGRYLEQALRVRGQTAPDQLPGFVDGLFTPQDEASMLVARVLAPEPGDRILDACAAPGTKTTHLAELIADRGKIVALDADRRRLSQIAGAAARLRLSSVSCLHGDARQAPRLVGRETMHRVLVDAPCSGLGTLARRPDLRWRKRPPDIKQLAELQSQILAAAAATVLPGGVLVYSTCTTTHEENEAVVTAFIKNHPQFQLEPLAQYLPPGLQDVVDVDGAWVQLWPHRHGTDGFFIARMVKQR